MVDAGRVDRQLDRVVGALEGKLPAAVEHLSTARDDLLALRPCPRDLAAGLVLHLKAALGATFL
jgi:hypothetical protein